MATFIKDMYRTTDAQLMLFRGESGDPWVNEAGQEMGLLLTTTKTRACKEITSKFRNQHRSKTATAAEQDRMGVDLCVAATVGFHNLQLEEGKGVVEYSDDIAREMFEKSDVIYKQVNDFLVADDNFLESAKNS